jgi:hypothetical protein
MKHRNFPVSFLGKTTNTYRLADERKIETL